MGVFVEIESTKDAVKPPAIRAYRSQKENAIPLSFGDKNKKKVKGISRRINLSFLFELSESATRLSRRAIKSHKDWLLAGYIALAIST